MKPFLLALVLLCFASVADAQCPNCRPGNCELKTVYIARQLPFGRVVIRSKVVVVPKQPQAAPKAEKQ